MTNTLVKGIMYNHPYLWSHISGTFWTTCSRHCERSVSNIYCAVPLPHAVLRTRQAYSRKWKVSANKGRSQRRINSGIRYPASVASEIHNVRSLRGKLAACWCLAFLCLAKMYLDTSGLSGSSETPPSVLGSVYPCPLRKNPIVRKSGHSLPHPCVVGSVRGPNYSDSCSALAFISVLLPENLPKIQGTQRQRIPSH